MGDVIATRRSKKVYKNHAHSMERANIGDKTEEKREIITRITKERQK